MKLILLILSSLTLATGRMEDDGLYRLNKNIQPLNYDLWIEPYLQESDGDKQFTFYGDVKIDINPIVYGVKNITLHTKNIKVNLIEVWPTFNHEDKLSIKNHTYNNITDKFTIVLENELRQNISYTVRIHYIGNIEDDLHGFYRSSYLNDHGKLRWVGATQLQRIEARRVFPCFDEPQLKSTFKVTIKRHRSYKSFSNTKLENSLPEGDWFIDTFERTPIMSTYLVAFLVADFVPRTEGDFLVVSRIEYYDKTAFSSAVGQKVLATLGNYTGLAYESLGNQLFQMATVPEFVHNGMENWGLILYKERVLVFEEGYTPISGKQYSITIITHETSHMWFGNAVTFDWWGYFWLNEGFARYFQYYTAHEMYPEYELDKQFVVEQMHPIFGTDAVVSTKLLTNPNVTSPSEIGSMFSSITYMKGASFIRMIRFAMGEDKFRIAIQDYLRHNQLSTTTPDDVFTHFKNNWPEDQYVNLDTFFLDWTEQVGFPVVTVTLSKDGTSMAVQQERFLLKPFDGSKKDIFYTIPFTFTTDLKKNFENTIPSLYLNKTNKKVVIVLSEPASWIIGNIQQSGYYRVNYDTKIRQNIRNSLIKENWSEIHEINRAQYVDDLMNLGRVGILNYDNVFYYLEYLETETKYLPWRAAFTGFSFLSDRLGMENKKIFENFIHKVTNKVFNILEVTEKSNDTILDIYNRDYIIKWACKSGNTRCLSLVKDIFSNLIQNNESVDVNIRPSIYCSAMRVATESEFDFLFNHVLQEIVSFEITLILSSLGCVKTKDLVEKYFELILSDNIQQKDKYNAMESLYSQNQENVWSVYELITKNVVEVANSLGSFSSVAEILSGIANRFTTEEQKVSFEFFIMENRDLFGDSAKTLNKALLTVEENLEWDEIHLPKLVAYLEKNRSAAEIHFLNSILILVIAITNLNFYWNN